MLFRIDNDTDITVSWFPGVATDNADPLASVIASPDADELITADGSLILTADGSSILAAVQSAQVKTILKTSSGDYLHDEGIRIRASSNDMNGSWALEALQVAFQMLPGLRRRSQ